MRALFFSTTLTLSLLVAGCGGVVLKDDYLSLDSGDRGVEGDDTGGALGDDTGALGDDTGAPGDDTGSAGDDTSPPEPQDEDGDGYTTEDDCDDSDADTYPGAPEPIDGEDNDCDGYVDDRSVCEDGTGDWTEIQEGIDEAEEGTTLLICPGLYPETLLISNKNVSLASTDGPEVTIVDAQASGSALKIERADGILIEGLTFQRGSEGGITCLNATIELLDNVVTDSTNRNGGAFYSDGCELDTFGNTFHDSQASESGGGVYLNSSRGSFSDNVVDGNVAVEGGGVLVYGGSMELARNEISNNTATTTDENLHGHGGGGGGLWVYATALFEDNVISGNTSYYNGGGVYTQYNNSEFIGNEISGNLCYEDGAGLFSNQGGLQVLENTFSDNEAYDDAGGLRIYVGTATIDGNTFSGNIAADDGGGLKMSHNENTVTNNLFEDNEAGDAGGGAELDNENTDVTSNTFRGNRAVRGAGLHTWLNESAHEIADNVFEDNEASDCGGGLALDNNSYTLTLHSNTFNDNEAVDGAALCIDLVEYDSDDDDEVDTYKISNIVVESGLFYGNEASDDGGAVYVKAGRVTLSNVTIVDNEGNTGSGVVTKEESVVTLRNAIISDNSGSAGVYIEDGELSASYSDVHGNEGGEYSGMSDPAGDDGNISVDPMLNGDYTLQAGSPCEDAGDPMLSDSDGSRSDMGTFGGPEGM